MKRLYVQSAVRFFILFVEKEKKVLKGPDKVILETKFLKVLKLLEEREGLSRNTKESDPWCLFHSNMIKLIIENIRHGY